MNERILPEKYHILSGSVLKVIAVATMLIDHIGYNLEAQPIQLFTLFGRQVMLHTLLRFIGRLAFPIFSFLLVEGYRHTRNAVRYVTTLLVFAVLSEVPFDLFLSDAWLSLDHQNVFFTLFLGFAGMYTYEKLKDRQILQVGAMLVLLLASASMRADYGTAGFCFIMLLYALRDHELLRDVSGLMILSANWISGLAFIPIAFYNGKRGFIKGLILKYAFYLFYPLHLLVLYFLRIRYFG